MTLFHVHNRLDFIIGIRFLLCVVQMKFIFDWKWYEGMLHTGEIIRDEQEKKKWAASDGETEE